MKNRPINISIPALTWDASTNAKNVECNTPLGGFRIQTNGSLHSPYVLIVVGEAQPRSEHDILADAKAEADRIYEAWVEARINRLIFSAAESDIAHIHISSPTL